MAEVKATLLRHSGEYDALKEQSDDDHADIAIIQTHVAENKRKLSDLETSIPNTYVTKTQFNDVVGVNVDITPVKTLDARITENTNAISSLGQNIDDLTDIVITPISQDVGALKTWRANTVDPHIADVGTKNDLDTDNTLFGRVKKAENTIGDAEKDAASATGSLFARIKKNAADLSTVDSRIAEAISKSAHLTREIVAFRYETQNIDGVDTPVLVGFTNQAGEAITEYDVNTIYMVRDNSTTGSDRYIEYLAFATPGQTGKVPFSSLDVIGSSDAKLENYVTKTNLTTTLADTLADYATKAYVDGAVRDLEETRLPIVLANYVKSATLAGDTENKLTPDATGNIDIPLALATKAGLVKSAPIDPTDPTKNANKVTVETDGTMTVNNLDVSRLVQFDPVEFVLDGGSAGVVNA